MKFKIKVEINSLKYNQSKLMSSAYSKLDDEITHGHTKSLDMINASFVMLSCFVGAGVLGLPYSFY